MISKLLRYIKHQHVGILALVIAMSGSAYALTLPRNSVGNRQMKDNAIKSKEVANGSLTKADLKSGTIPPAPRKFYWALINSSGSVERSSGGVTSTYGDNGGGNPQYRVTFPSDVSNCAYQATASNPDAVSSAMWVVPRVMTAAAATSNNRTVAVGNNLSNDGGGDDQWIITQGDFMLSVFC